MGNTWAMKSEEIQSFGFDSSVNCFAFLLEYLQQTFNQRKRKQHLKKVLIYHL